MYSESQRITFPAKGVTCEGLLTRSDADGRAPGIIICHPHPLRGGDLSNAVVRALAEAFAAVGFATLRFNFRGVGRSFRGGLEMALGSRKMRRQPWKG